MRHKTATEIAQTMIDRITTSNLIELHEYSYKANLPEDDQAAVRKLRGWIVQALEQRDPEAFQAWVKARGPARENLRSFFKEGENNVDPQQPEGMDQQRSF